MIVVQRALGVTTNYHILEAQFHTMSTGIMMDSSSRNIYNGCAIMLFMDLRDCLLVSIIERI